MIQELILINKIIMENTVFNIAWQIRNMDIIKYLINDPRINYNIKNHQNYTPFYFMFALLFDKFDDIDLFLDNPKIDINNYL